MKEDFKILEEVSLPSNLDCYFYDTFYDIYCSTIFSERGHETVYKYLVPKYTTINNERVNISGYHKKGLTCRLKNKNELRGEDLLYSLNIQFISEFPIPIEDRKLWKEVCDRLEIKDSKVLNQRVIIVDFFCPKGGFVIEADSKKFHLRSEFQKSKDLAKDLYLYEKFKIMVRRIYPLLEFPENSPLSRDKKLLEFRFKDLMESNGNIKHGLEVSELLPYRFENP